MTSSHISQSREKQNHQTNPPHTSLHQGYTTHVCIFLSGCSFIIQSLHSYSDPTCPQHRKNFAPSAKPSLYCIIHQCLPKGLFLSAYVYALCVLKANHHVCVDPTSPSSNHHIHCSLSQPNIFEEPGSSRSPHVIAFLWNESPLHFPASKFTLYLSERPSPITLPKTVLLILVPFSDHDLIPSHHLLLYFFFIVVLFVCLFVFMVGRLFDPSPDYKLPTDRNRVQLDTGVLSMSSTQAPNIP